MNNKQLVGGKYIRITGKDNKEYLTTPKTIEHTDELYLESCERIDEEKAKELGLTLDEYYQMMEEKEHFESLYF